MEKHSYIFRHHDIQWRHSSRRVAKFAFQVMPLFKQWTEEFFVPHRDHLSKCRSTGSATGTLARLTSRPPAKPVNPVGAPICGIFVNTGKFQKRDPQGCRARREESNGIPNFLVALLEFTQKFVEVFRTSMNFCVNSRRAKRKLGIPFDSSRRALQPWGSRFWNFPLLKKVTFLGFPHIGDPFWVQNNSVWVSWFCDGGRIIQFGCRDFVTESE